MRVVSNVRQVTAEQIRAAKNIDILDYLMRHEPESLKRVGNRYVLADHDSFVISNGKWYWNSQNFGSNTATALNYLIKVRGYKFVDAVCVLCDDTVDARHISPKANSPPYKPKSFVLPPQNANNNRVIAYLQSRGIDRQLIIDCIERGSLYESAKYHNCTFIGRDDNGRVRFAAMRSTVGNFKRDVDGSDKRYGFVIPPKNANSNTLAVFESPIDALSHQTLFPDSNVWRLSLDGTAPLALMHFITHHPKISECIVCTDNDDAGHSAAAGICEMLDTLNITTSRVLPHAGADWNESLQIIMKEVKPMEDVRKDIRFVDADSNLLFSIKDGNSIKITRGYDGGEVVKKCRFLDETHLTVGSNTYHINEFAERMKKTGNRCEPVPNQKPKLNVLSANYGESLQSVEISMTEAALRKLVGGKYEVAMLTEENAASPCAIVRGTEGIAICGILDGTLTSLHPYRTQGYKRELSPAERPAQKSSLLCNLDVAKTAVAAHNAENPGKQKTTESR